MKTEMNNDMGTCRVATLLVQVHKSWSLALYIMKLKENSLNSNSFDLE